jgi:hypothetical protein
LRHRELVVGLVDDLEGRLRLERQHLLQVTELPALEQEEVPPAPVAADPLLELLGPS